jgi:hypothetical protein
MISIPRIEKPIAWLTRLSRVATLCSTCRLGNESGVSVFESDTRANLRLKLAVPSIGLVLFDRRLQWIFPCLPSFEPCLLTPTRKAARSLRKTSRIPKIPSRRILWQRRKVRNIYSRGAKPQESPHKAHTLQVVKRKPIIKIRVFYSFGFLIQCSLSELRPPAAG